MLSNQNMPLSADENRPRLLIVDDESEVRRALRRLFRRNYDVLDAADGAEALEILQDEQFDLIISDMRMPGMSGAELLKSCYLLYPDMARLLLTGFSDLDSTILAVNEGRIHRYVGKPWDNDELNAIVAEIIDLHQLKSANESLNARVVEQNAELARLNRELEQKYLQKSDQVGEAESKLREAYRSLHHEFNSMVHILTGLIEARIGEEPGSTEKFARLAKSFAEFAGLQGQQIQDVYFAALLKNFGKVSLSDAVIRKSLTQLNANEKKEYAHFSVNGQTSLMLLEPLQNASNIIRSHTELYNGRGFPDRLAGDAIPLEARILRIASDYVELQREHNFLGEKLSEENARIYLLKMASQRYDRELVDVFMDVLEDFSEGVVSQVERITIREARAGMVLEDNLYSPSGTVLLSADTRLTERHIEKLRALQRQFEGHDIMLHIARQDANQASSS